MSQSSRSHAGRFERWRAQSAGLLARSVIIYWNTGSLAHSLNTAYVAEMLLGTYDGANYELYFDVHAARELATSMVAMAADQDAFEDWTRDRGLGPENREKGAFGLCSACGGCRIIANINGDLLPAGVWSGEVKRHGADSEPSGSVVVRAGEAVECNSCMRGDPRGGWPGNLALEFANEMVACGSCKDGRVRAECSNTRCSEGLLAGEMSVNVTDAIDAALSGGPSTCTITQINAQGVCGVQCPTCKGRGSARARCSVCREKRSKLRQAPMGRSIARVGQRLLDMLDGRCAWAPSAGRQASECQVCSGRALQATPPGHRYIRMGSAGLGGVYYVHSLKCVCGESENETVVLREDCHSCKGTGHNLRGVVPAVEWPAVVRRRCLEHTTHDLHPPRGVPGLEPGRSWVRVLGERETHEGMPLDSRFLAKPGPEPSWRLLTPETRVVPRGQHRNLTSETPRDQLRGWVPRGGDGPECWPRWYRGEERHAQQRRAREVANSFTEPAWSHDIFIDDISCPNSAPESD